MCSKLTLKLSCNPQMANIQNLEGVLSTLGTTVRVNNDERNEFPGMSNSAQMNIPGEQNEDVVVEDEGGSNGSEKDYVAQMMNNAIGVDG